LFIRTVGAPPAPFFFWLILATMLLGGWLGWLANRRTVMLGQLLSVVGLLLLFINPPAREIVLAAAVGFGLSVAALWLMPALGSAYVRESAWLWPYLPAAGATTPRRHRTSSRASSPGFWRETLWPGSAVVAT